MPGIAVDCSCGWWSSTGVDALSKCQSGSNKKCTIFDTNQTKCPAPTANPQQACNISLSYQFPWANLLALNQLTVINGYYIVQSGKWCSKAYYKSADNNYIFFDSGSGKWYVAPTLGPSNVRPVFAFAWSNADFVQDASGWRTWHGNYYGWAYDSSLKIMGG
jgi:hypothetical protein